jgi:hypothetical protein
MEGVNFGVVDDEHGRLLGSEGGWVNYTQDWGWANLHWED